MTPRLLTTLAFFLTPVVLGLLLARLRPGGEGIELRRIDVLVPAGLGLQLVAAGSRPVVLGAGYALLLGWAAIRVATARGIARTAFGLLLAGCVLNVLPILLNGAMPYRASAATAAGDGLKGTPITDATVLPALGDVIPLPSGKLMSVGDVVLAAGVVLAVSLALRATASRAGRHPGTPNAASA